MAADPIDPTTFTRGETEFSVEGERGRFTFLRINPDGSLHAWGGLSGREKLRDIRPSRVTKIHKPKNQPKKGNTQ